MPTFKRDGVELHYELDGDGPPVVLISGFTGHSNDGCNMWMRQALAARHTVLSVDNRGSGQTITPASARVTIEDMADDIAAIIDHLRLGMVHTLGVSMGGCITLMLSLRHPQKLCGQVVAVSTARGAAAMPATMFMMETYRLTIDQKLPQALIYRVAAIAMLGEPVFANADFINAWVNSPPDPLTQSRAGYDQQVSALLHYDIAERLASITTPTLVVSSPDDILLPAHYQDEIAASIPGAEIRRYPGGHLFMYLPMYIEAFVRDVEAFWSAHS